MTKKRLSQDIKIGIMNHVAILVLSLGLVGFSLFVLLDDASISFVEDDTEWVYVGTPTAYAIKDTPDTTFTITPYLNEYAQLLALCITLGVFVVFISRRRIPRL